MSTDRVRAERTGRTTEGGERTRTTAPSTNVSGRERRIRALHETMGNRGVQELHRRGVLRSTPVDGATSTAVPDAAPTETPAGPAVSAEEGEPSAAGSGGAPAGGGGGGAESGGTTGGEPAAEGEGETEEADSEAGLESEEAAGAPLAEPGAVGEGGPTGPGGGGGAGGPELLMPEPPTGLTDEEQARLESTRQAATETAERAVDSLPPGGENVTEAREAVTEPEAETQARAESDLVDALGEQPTPSPEIEELCDRIRTIIREKRPADEDSLVEAEPEEMAQAAGGELDSSVRTKTEDVQGEYAEIERPPSGTREQVGDERPSQPDMPPTPPIDAGSAVPDGVSQDHVDLGPDVAAAGQRIDDAGMNSEPARLVESGPIAEARAAESDLEETAQQEPGEVLAEQQSALADAQADMAALQASAVQALTSSRAETAGRTESQQEGMVESEQQTRERLSSEAQGIFASAQERVLGQLEPLPDTAMTQWEEGVEVLSIQFDQQLAEVQRWIDERYSGAGGAILEVWEGWTGMPDWIVAAYDRAEQAFGDGVCALIRKISTDVNGVIAACEAIIADARTRINELFSQELPAELQSWAAEQQAQFNERLDGLHEQAMQTRDDFNRDLTRRAAGAVQEVRERVQSLREAARGILGRLADAVDRFLEDPARFIIEGLLELVGIPPASFWAVVDRLGDVVHSIADDPMTFANTLLSALGQGFQQFFDKVGDYLLDGLLDWLFSGLGSVGVEIPGDFSLGSVITFFLQLMGLTWDRIREVLAKHIGEENIALLEQAYDIISNLIEMGPEGVYEMIKEQLDPQNILDQVLDAAVSFVVETLITQVTARVIALFNPAGAIVQAVEAVYRVLKWVFENAARIFSLVETIVNGAAALVAGDTGGMATAVEGALARLIAPVIDFLAGYAGLGDLPEKIADVIRGLQDWVMGIVDRVVGFIAGQAQRLLGALGIGGGEEGGPDADTASAVGATVPVVTDDESHTMFFEADGNQAVLYVRSGKKKLATWLTDWKGRVSELPPDAQAEANRLIALIEGKLTEVQSDATSILVSRGRQGEGSQMQPHPNRQSDLVAEEEELEPSVRQLFEFFTERNAPSRDRIERAQSVNEFLTGFSVNKWGTHFGVSKSTSYRDINVGKEEGTVEEATNGYKIKGLDRADLVSAARRELTNRGPSHLGHGNATFGYEQIKEFFASASTERLPSDRRRYSPKLIDDVAQGLVGKGLTEEGSGRYRWSLEEVERRELPSSWSGDNVRYKYYIRSSGFNSMKKTIHKERFKDVTDAIDALESDDESTQVEGEVAWAGLAVEEIVPTYQYDPTMRSDYLNPSNYDVDHTVPLAWHWQYGGGNDLEQEKRLEIAGGRDNLTLMWGAINRSKGSQHPEFGTEGRYTAKFWVGPNFTHHWTDSKGFMYADASTKFANFQEL